MIAKECAERRVPTSVFARKATLAQLVERLIRNHKVSLRFQLFAALVDE
jgi:hypothetical protein